MKIKGYLKKSEKKRRTPGRCMWYHLGICNRGGRGRSAEWEGLNQQKKKRKKKKKKRPLLIRSINDRFLGEKKKLQETINTVSLKTRILGRSQRRRKGTQGYEAGT